MENFQKEAIAQAYEDVRNDSTDTIWWVDTIINTIQLLIQ